MPATRTHLGRRFLCNAPGKWQHSSAGYRWRMTRTETGTWRVTGPGISMADHTDADSWEDAADIVCSVVAATILADRQAAAEPPPDKSAPDVDPGGTHLSPDDALHEGPRNACLTCVAHDLAARGNEAPEEITADEDRPASERLTELMTGVAAPGYALVGVAGDWARAAMSLAIDIDTEALRLVAICPPHLRDWADTEVRRREEAFTLAYSVSDALTHPSLAALRSVYRDLAAGDAR